jgi:hypothetical protein
MVTVYVTDTKSTNVGDVHMDITIAHSCQLLSVTLNGYFFFVLYYNVQKRQAFRQMCVVIFMSDRTLKLCNFS